jgi:hypothetical protein
VTHDERRTPEDANTAGAGQGGRRAPTAAVA